ncbi:MAG: YCII-related protein [Solirubrobacterales bacterium]|jgi:hypothetical protein|nr:YCII-related protein [Solirubrobacterales bacterium]
MLYTILIYGDPAAIPADFDQDAARTAWMSLTQEMGEAGVLRGGEALEPTDTATTLRERDGELVSTDGPFAETKEILGGFYLIDVDDLDAALSWAARMPNIGYASIEVRPVMPTH